MPAHGLRTIFLRFWEGIIKTSKIHNLFIECQILHILVHWNPLDMGTRPIKNKIISILVKNVSSYIVIYFYCKIHSWRAQLVYQAIPNRFCTLSSHICTHPHATK
jgi:hypothetical protein